ncbi:hypothetical protein [Aliidiomarina quisquiliarum]|uniref:hypothetical protein n=1 Tax=Aliidiomarina quisquiliarum TaxID=2938947 RepID=UPI00208EC635|nr:hypothetical protein [Aliidiomarina quisquiliarum]MCO4320030.1 hypothetical protein [Aliidiomarina quisquiliarum]
MSLRSTYQRYKEEQQEGRGPYKNRLIAYGLFLLLFLMAIILPALISPIGAFSSYVVDNLLLVAILVLIPVTKNFKFTEAVIPYLVGLLATFVLLSHLVRDLLGIERSSFGDDFNVVLFTFSILYMVFAQTVAILIAKQITGTKFQN